MYEQEHIDLLNIYGVLTAAMLARKFKIRTDTACDILSAIVCDYENVKIKNRHQIFIEGREWEEWFLKSSRPYKKKPSKWKDVSKP